MPAFGDLCRLQLLNGSHERECERLCKSLYQKTQSFNEGKDKHSSSPCPVFIFPVPLPVLFAAGGFLSGSAWLRAGLSQAQGCCGRRGVSCNADKSHPSSFLGEFDIESRGSPGLELGEKGWEVCVASPSTVP